MKERSVKIDARYPARYPESPKVILHFAIADVALAT